MENSKLAELFRNIAQILEIKGGNPFRIRAYQRAAQNIESLPQAIESYIAQDTLTQIPGIGKDLSERIKEYVRTGHIPIYEALKKSIPEGLLDLLSIPTVGPKTAKLLYEQLKVKNIADLEKAIAAHTLDGLFGIKEKTIENITKGIALCKGGRERMTIAQATLAAEQFLSTLKKLPGILNISVAGSLRRQKDTVRDIDILVATKTPKKVIAAFLKAPEVKDVLAAGETKASVRTRSGVQVDCRVVSATQFGAALFYFTGSKNFNIKMRQIAIKKGLKINEYGVFRGKNCIAGRDEEGIFKLFNLSYIEPELRENNGEIELARTHTLPRLITPQDIKGDLHAHSNFSDGKNSIEEMAQAAIDLGYSYIAITDHSESLKIAHGLGLKDLKKKRSEIESLNSRLKNFRVLYGTEVDIGPRGELDYKDELLKEFDFVVAAVHSGFKQTKEQLTQRIVRACENKFVHSIAHPTGKLWGVREAYDLDFNRILKVARNTNTHFEINAFPDRLDLNETCARMCKENGVKLSIGTDAHAIEQLLGMKFGVAVARRGWLSAKDVLNTLSLDELLKAIKK